MIISHEGKFNALILMLPFRGWGLPRKDQDQKIKNKKVKINMAK